VRSKRVLRPALIAAGLLMVGVASGSSAVSSATGTITTVVGTGAGAVGPGVDGGPATGTAIDHPRGLLIDAGGGLLIAEPFRNTVRRVSADGRSFRAAGTGVAGYSGDGGPALEARLNGVHGVAATTDGGYVLADTGNNRIRRVSPNGTITTVAGNGDGGFSGDGAPATEAQINAPRGVATLADGGILIPDSSNHRIRLVAADGTITTVAGTGVPGFSGDGGPAVAAQLDLPFAVAPLRNGGFLLADAGDNRIRRVGPDGVITTVAGTGVGGFSGDGRSAVQAEVASPHAVAALPGGGFLVADTFNHRVRRVWPDGTITTVAGTGVPGFSGEGGRAALAELNLPKALAILPDASGFLVGDAANNRVRLVRINLRPPLELRVTSTRLRSRAGRAAMIRYTLSDAATMRLSVLERGKMVVRATARADRGPNRLSFGGSLRPGSYALRLVAETPDGRSARSTASLRVVR
jgi:NHL repeat